MVDENAIPDTRVETYTDETVEFALQACLKKGDTQSLVLLVGLVTIASALSEISTSLNDIAKEL